MALCAVQTYCRSLTIKLQRAGGIATPGFLE